MKWLIVQVKTVEHGRFHTIQHAQHLCQALHKAWGTHCEPWIKQKMPLIAQSLHPNARDGKLPSKQIKEKHTFEVWQRYVEKETRRCDGMRSPECGARGRRSQGNSLREDDTMTFKLRPEWWQIVSHVNIHRESRQPRRENPRLQTPVWSRLGYQFQRGQQTEVKGLTPTCTWTKGTHLGACCGADQCFYLQTHQVPFYSEHKRNGFIISPIALCYIKILTGEHNSAKWVHSYFAVASVNCRTVFCKSNITTQRKIHKDAHILWPTNSTPREFIQVNNLAQ